MREIFLEEARKAFTRKLCKMKKNEMFFFSIRKESAINTHTNNTLSQPSYVNAIKRKEGRKKSIRKK